MSDTTMLATLIALEESLHRLETRQNPDSLEALLHKEFVEIGRSGRRFNRQDLLAEYGNGDPLPAVVASDYTLEHIQPGLWLLTYETVQIGSDGGNEKHTLRASLWQETHAGPRLRFHQGTPGHV